ncbi:MAG TPA: class I SAM-dependent methyltransferase [Opitutaceae bacterium]|nr:class I SAM-dependent methyltransferase [Opitutaceae bacterium]
MSAPPTVRRITGATVRRDFDDPNVVIHYTRAAAFLGLWASEWSLIERWLPDRDAPLLDAGCGAGRASLALWDLGYRHLTGVDFSRELVAQARSLAAERGAAIEFIRADLTRWRPTQRRPARAKRLTRRQRDRVCHLLNDKLAEAAGAGTGFAGVLFLFNGLMQIPGRGRRRAALRRLRAASRPGAVLILTTHDRDDGARERPHWAEEAARWARGRQDPRLREFGDRYFPDDHGGRTFMHLPTRAEVLEDLAATGWALRFDAMRREISPESAAVRNFSDECRFWVAQRAAGPAP